MSYFSIKYANVATSRYKGLSRSDFWYLEPTLAIEVLRISREKLLKGVLVGHDIADHPVVDFQERNECIHWGVGFFLRDTKPFTQRVIEFGPSHQRIFRFGTLFTPFRQGSLTRFLAFHDGIAPSSYSECRRGSVIFRVQKCREYLISTIVSKQRKKTTRQKLIKSSIQKHSHPTKRRKLRARGSLFLSLFPN